MADDSKIIREINEWWGNSDDLGNKPYPEEPQQPPEPEESHPVDKVVPKEDDKPKFSKEAYGYTMLGLSILLKKRVSDFMDGANNLDKIKEDLVKFKEIVDGVE